MPIRFKFRSSVNFDTVEIDGGREWITVAELRDKIIKCKKLNVRNDGFDLVFSDAISGQEYNDDGFRIVNGSSIIIRRVPAGAVPSAIQRIENVQCFGAKNSIPLSPVQAVGARDEFDDFGADVSPFPDTTLPDVVKFDKSNLGSTEKAGSRLGCEKPDDFCQAAHRGSNHSENERILREPGVEQTKLEKLLARQNVDLPSELKCPLCNTYFKEAVMMPCCQHSFCEKCIGVVLVEDRGCPKCFSRKCRPGDLLPNLSLRQAIQHLLESQMTNSCSEYALRKDAPDGESGIQGGNRNSAPSPEKEHVRGEEGGCVQIGAEVDFEGENQPLTSAQGLVNDEADSAPRKRRALLKDAGGHRNFLPTGGNKRVDRTCYMCGSPDHLIRDCPIAFTRQRMLPPGNGVYPRSVPGYTPPFWNHNSLAPYRPLQNIYGSPGMTSFNASMVPVTPYAMPTYNPFMLGRLQGHGSIMRMEGMMPPAVNRAEWPTGNSKHMEAKHYEERRHHSNQNLVSVQHHNVDDSHECRKRDRYYEPERSQVDKYNRQRARSFSHSDDSSPQRSRRKHYHQKCIASNHHSSDGKHKKSSHCGEDLRPCASERSDSCIREIPNSSDRACGERHEHHHRNTGGHHRRDQYGRDSGWSQHEGHKEEFKRRIDSNIRGSYKKHHTSLDSALEPSSRDERRRYSDRGTYHDYRHPRHRTKRPNEELHDDSRPMVSGADDDRRDGHHGYKRKRVH